MPVRNDALAQVGKDEAMTNYSTRKVPVITENDGLDFTIHALVYPGGRVQLVTNGPRLVVTDVYVDRAAARSGVTVRPEPIESTSERSAPEPHVWVESEEG
jgi:hypothetical protein